MPFFLYWFGEDTPTFSIPKIPDELPRLGSFPIKWDRSQLFFTQKGLEKGIWAGSLAQSLSICLSVGHFFRKLNLATSPGRRATGPA
jgi:hypothetical protein